MKSHFILYFLIAFSLFSIRALAQEKNSLIASCCESPEFGRCTGSASCRACTSCNYCKHCSNGGSCGVCSNNSTSNYNYYISPNNSKPKIKSSKPSVNSRGNKSTHYRSSDNLNYKPSKVYVITQSVNLRKGPGTNFSIIKTLTYFDELEVLGISGEWIKVKLKNTIIIGFVHSKYVQ